MDVLKKISIVDVATGESLFVFSGEALVPYLVLMGGHRYSMDCSREFELKIETDSGGNKECDSCGGLIGLNFSIPKSEIEDTD